MRAELLRRARGCATRVLFEGIPVLAKGTRCVRAIAAV
jgi:hypothetical protein